MIDDEQENDLEAVSEEMSERTCVGCRRKDDAKALLRLAVSPEPPYVAPDRGSYHTARRPILVSCFAWMRLPRGCSSAREKG